MTNETGADTQVATPTAVDHPTWDFNVSHATNEDVQVHGGTVTDTSKEQTDVHAHVSDYFAHAAEGSISSASLGLNHGFEHSHDTFQSFDIHETHPAPGIESHPATIDHSAPSFETTHHDAFADTHHAQDAFVDHGGHDSGASHGGGDHGGQSHDHGIGGM